MVFSVTVMSHDCNFYFSPTACSTGSQSNEAMPPLTAAQKRQKEKDRKRRQKELDAIAQEHALHDLASGSPGERREAEIIRMKQQLAEIGRSVVEMPPDGNCLFHALTHQLGDPSISPEEMRALIVEHIRSHRDEFNSFIIDEAVVDPFEAYCTHMSMDGVWGSLLEVRAAAERFHVVIAVVAASGLTLVGGECLPNDAPWAIAYYDHLYTLGSHFNATSRSGMGIGACDQQEEES
jgi:OTU domain-containing protein 6